MSGPPTLPKRRSIRLPGFDYSRIGQYFVTICAFEKRNLFGSIADEHVNLNSIGDIAEFCWIEVPKHFSAVDLGEFIVMPNHVHAILTITNRARHAVPLRERRHAETFSHPNPHSLATIIRSYKSQVSKQIRAVLQSPKFALWQRGFYEHVLRNSTDYANATRYVLQNPKRWAQKQNLAPP